MATTEVPVSKRILIVDDDQDVHQWKFLLVAPSDRDYRLESAYDGLEGFNKIREAHWDLVITDVIMPLMDGIELLAQVHRIRAEMPVVLMTVDSTAEEDRGKAIGEHAFSWLQKPFTKQAVIELVESALGAPRLADDIQVNTIYP